MLQIFRTVNGITLMFLFCFVWNHFSSPKITFGLSIHRKFYNIDTLKRFLFFLTLKYFLLFENNQNIEFKL